MKIYVASSLENYTTVLLLEKELVSKGHTITHSWATDYKLETESGVLPCDVDTAQKCKEGVMEADALILLVTNKSRGAHIEFGIALGAKIPTFILCQDPALWVSFYTLGRSYLRLTELMQDVEEEAKDFSVNQYYRMGV